MAETLAASSLILPMISAICPEDLPISSAMTPKNLPILLFLGALDADIETDHGEIGRHLFGFLAIPIKTGHIGQLSFR